MPGLIGLMQATETIKLITGIGTPLDGRLLVVDALTMRFRELTLRVDPERPPITRLVDYSQFCQPESIAMEPSQIPSITVLELKALLDSGADDLVLVDVRNPAEAEVACINGATLIPLSTIESGEAVERVRQLSEGRRLFVHCKLGGRSLRALQTLAGHGIHGTNIEGGIDAWAEQVEPDLPRY